MGSKPAPDEVGCRVLVVDDEDSLQFALKEVLRRKGYGVEGASDGFEALAALDAFDPHICLVDYSMPKMNGLELLKRIRDRRPESVVIMMTAYGTEALAVECMKSGAYDYFVKPFNNEEMLLVVRKASEKIALVEENKRLRAAMAGVAGAKRIIGESPRMKEVLALIEQVSATEVTVLIQGESGTGKELVASAIHHGSGRCSGPFVKLNCAALPETLIESELFGYDAGAFTGAVSAKKGRFELAHGGTIFLDEIGDMTLSTQTKVLRVLQEREFERLGGNKVLKVDVRIIAATHQDLQEKIGDGSFREDLYYRLNVVAIRLPALRERREDVELLAYHFLDQQNRRYGKDHREIPASVLGRMLDYAWPGNVRELENAVARAVVLDDFDQIVPWPSYEVRSELVGSLEGLAALPYKKAKSFLVEKFERLYLARLMERAEGNVSRAAKLAGMHRKNFWEKLVRHDLSTRSRPEDGEGEGEEGGDQG